MFGPKWLWCRSKPMCGTEKKEVMGMYAFFCYLVFVFCLTKTSFAIEEVKSTEDGTSASVKGVFIFLISA